MKKKDSLKINQNKDGSYTAEWDKQDPEWSWMNNSKEIHQKKMYHLYDEELYHKNDIRNYLCDRKYDISCETFDYIKYKWHFRTITYLAISSARL